MTVKVTHLTSKFVSLVSRALLLALLVTAVSTTSALAQDDQAHKKVYNAAVEAAKAKNYTLAYTKYQEAATLAKKAGDQDVVDLSNKVLAQLDKINGNKLLKKEQYAEAKVEFEEGISHDPDYAPNHYGVGLAMKNLGDLEGAIAIWKKTMEVAEASRDHKTGSIAEAAIRDNLYYGASSRVSKQNPTRADADAALAALEDAKQFIEPDADWYYYAAVAHNIKGDYAQATTLADKALELHKGSKTDKAKIYFAKGEALMYAGDNAGAKDAFTNASFGSYAASAKHYLETL